MITLFSMPKAFDGEFAAIQRNAISSWTCLPRSPEIILFGNERGTAQICREFGIVHVPDVARNSSGIPFLNDMFAKVQEMASYELLCYVNADIILTARLVEAIDLLSEKIGRFAMFCHPWNLKMEDEPKFGSSNWQDQLLTSARSRGKEPSGVGSDVFVFPRGFYASVPPFLLGRTVYDNWLLYTASRSRLPAVDATQFVLAIHQDHSGSTHGSGIPITEEVRRNRKLAGWLARGFYATHLPYELQRNGEVRKRGVLERVRRRAHVMLWPVIFPVLERTYHTRRKIGLYRR